MSTTRRTFLTGSAAALAAAQPKAKAGSIKLGLYSITYAGLWYRGRPLTLEEVIDRAKQYGYQGVEIGGKRPHGNPLDMPKARCQQLRKYAADRGIEIFAVAGNNDFSSPIPEHRECQILYTREMMRMTADLGAKILRVFLGWPGVTKVPGQGGSYEHARKVFAAEHEGFSEEQIWDWCRESMKECARYARDFGVTLALQNHKPVIKDYRDVLRMVKEVDSPNLKVVYDAPLMDDKSEAAIRKAAFEVGALQTTSHFGGEYDRDASGKIVSKGSEIYPYFVRAMLDIGYRGYISYELCHRLPVVNGNTVGLEYPEKSAQLAAEFMRGVIADAEKAPRLKSA
ncbi:MAG: sugar phosphate isomerase/epimerase family protein [Bryobacteraceae bacterium]